VFVGFWDTVLSDQDGHGRLFANGTRLLLGRRARGRWADERWLRRAFVLGLTTVLPIGLYLGIGQPVALLRLAGAIEAADIPVVRGLVLHLNHRLRPAGLRPAWPTFAATLLAGAFFAAFAVVHVVDLATG